MLRCVSEVIGYVIAATDGSIGKADDFFFDDHRWTIRYLVVDTGKWLTGRRVLIAPQALGQIDWQKQQFSVALTRDQIARSPEVDADKPVARQQEIEVFKYYSWKPYWGDTTAGPFSLPAGVTVPEDLGAEVEKGDPNLRSTKHLGSYHVSAADGDIGHIDDFILDDESWTIRYVVVDTRNWIQGRKVIVSPQWFKEIDWANRKIRTDLSKGDIRNSPPFDPTQPVNRHYEERLYDYHGRPKYWSST